MALNRPISAETTCGLNEPEKFYSHSEIIISPSLRKMDVCDNEDPQFSHPVEFMVDGDTNTWWQSTSRRRLRKVGVSPSDADSVIILDLQQAFRVEEIVLLMGDSRRPGRIAIQKSFNGNAFHPWSYKVSDEADCWNEFNTPSKSQPEVENSATCMSFIRSASASKNEQILFDFKDVNIVEWKSARYIKVMFYDMHTSLGTTRESADLFHHYTVRELEVWAKCVCNGQELGCERNPTSGKFQCICGGNTSGASCNECLPLFNQRPFQKGRPCERCQCHGHAEYCIFVPSIKQQRLSKNIAGIYEGGGVCQECKDNTTGVNCQKCLDLFYRPRGNSPFDSNPCQPCICNTSGVLVAENMGIIRGMCVKDDEESLQRNMLPGNCFCKANVAGSKCSTCKEGFFGLDEANVDGCSPCDCNLAGTVTNTKICDTVTGQCPCKPYVEGRQCNVCLDGFYNLDAVNPQGCAKCECDIGGSAKDGCNKNTGSCTCRTNLEEPRCDKPLRNYFVPDVHNIHVEVEDINNLSFDRDKNNPGFFGHGYTILEGEDNLRIVLTVPDGFSGEYYIILRYIMTASGLVTMDLSSGTNDIFEISTVLPLCSDTWCNELVGDFGIPASINLIPRTRYKVRIKTQLTGTLLLDRIVALPVEFYIPELLDPTEALEFAFRCNVVANDFTANPDYCQARIFSLVSYYYNGATPCNCHSLGSFNTTCNPYGGQCPCKKGITGRTCDQCDVAHYDLTRIGCKPCNCSRLSKVCDAESGQCQCPANTQGQRCDMCSANHWGYNVTSGCMPCNCNRTGSVTSQCDFSTGQCKCKQGVTGDMCDRCSEGFKLFSNSGCTTCGCDSRGSETPNCDDMTGQCHCKNLTGGLLCDQCAENTFSKSELHQSGCLECVCMGITSNCATSNLYVVKNQLDNFSDWLIVNKDGTYFGLDFNITEINGREAITADIPGGGEFFWDVPELRGNLLLTVGSNLEFTARYTEENLNFFGVSLQQPFVVIKGNKNINLVSVLPEVPPGVTTHVSVKMDHASWMEENSFQEITTRSRFILALSKVENFLVPASFFLQPHNTTMYNFSIGDSVSQVKGQKAVSVELCACGKGYTGTSCEECDSGNYRTNYETHDYLGECAPCDCHSHSDTCNMTTGECLNCRHNTRGFNCEVCAEGYHGDATAGGPNDCRRCPCIVPRVNRTECEVIDSVNVRCLYCNQGYSSDLCNECEPFYYGNPEDTDGTCKPCFCNGNSNECDPKTGQCLNCQFNTISYNCETCALGFYGNASLQVKLQFTV